MNCDPGIICFQHCEHKAFCFELPTVCPTCGSSLSDSEFNILPFRVPYPFVRAAQHPCCIVIKPTVGDFLNDFFNSMDLHIGVTDSSGIVVEFDKNGLHKHNSSNWDQCIALNGLIEPWIHHWDEILGLTIKDNDWSANRYNELELNCYSFVLKFLQRLDDGYYSKSAFSKTIFCEKFIVPQTTSAGKYISLFRKLKNNNIFINYGRKCDISSYPESVPSR